MPASFSTTSRFSESHLSHASTTAFRLRRAFAVASGSTTLLPESSSFERVGHVPLSACVSIWATVTLTTVL